MSGTHHYHVMVGHYHYMVMVGPRHKSPDCSPPPICILKRAVEWVAVVRPNTNTRTTRTLIHAPRN